MAAGPGRAITSDVDVRDVFASKHLGFRPIAQQREYSCGAAAVVSVMRYFGHQANEAQTIESMGTNPVIGTKAQDMIAYFRKRDMRASAYTETPFEVLVERVCAQKVTLVDWNDWGGHWVVVTGWEPRMQVIVLADPARPRSHFAAHSKAQFIEHWHCPPFEEGAKLRQLALLVNPDGSKRKLKQAPRIESYRQVVRARQRFQRMSGKMQDVDPLPEDPRNLTETAPRYVRSQQAWPRPG